MDAQQPTHGTPQAPEPVYQTPEWETPSRPQRRSLLARLVSSKPSGAAPATTAYNAAPTKETAAPAAAAAPPIGANPSVAQSMRARFDHILPPHRTYFGRSRRFLVLAVILPLAILIFVVVPLAVGLGVGLSRKHSGSHNLPLPSKGGIYTGDLTYYAPGLGACGIESTDQSAICAVSHLLFDAVQTGSNPNANQLCGKKIRITRDFVEENKGNRSVDVTVVDRCVGCREYDLDLSIAMFTQLAEEAEGRVLGSWAWLD